MTTDITDNIVEEYAEFGELAVTGWLKTIVWISRITGTISAISSLIIVITLVYDRKRKLAKPNNRILLAMSCIDIPLSIVYALGTAMIPQDTGVYGAIGSDVTCTIQGFILYIGGASTPYYNACLCLYYLLIIRYKMRISDFAKRIEPIVHGWCLLIPTGTAIACVILGMMNPYYDVCFVRDAECFDIDCTSETFYLMSSIFFIGFFTSFAVVVYSLLRIYYGYVKLRKSMERYSFANQNQQTKAEIESSKQAILYIFAFIITDLWSFSNYILITTTGQSSPILAVATSIFLPLQGFWNCLIFSRPIINRIKKKFPNVSLCFALRIMMFHPSAIGQRGDLAHFNSIAGRMMISRLRNSFSRRLSRNSTSGDGMIQSATNLALNQENVIITV